jgi:hypothetical protein
MNQDVVVVGGDFVVQTESNQSPRNPNEVNPPVDGGQVEGDASDLLQTSSD